MRDLWADADTDIIIIGHYARTLRKDPSHVANIFNRGEMFYSWSMHFIV